MTESEINKLAESFIDAELRAIELSKSRLGDDFSKVIHQLLATQGKVIVSGLGKSGIIARKIAATLSSTGTPAMYLHPSEALHGDLGVIQSSDSVLILSNSGETAELVLLARSVRSIGPPVISIVGNTKSSLSKVSNYILDAGVPREACPLDLAPTSSTTVSMVLGDAIALVLMRMRGITRQQFALCHPGGSLGKRLLLRVVDIMHSVDTLPTIRPSSTFHEVLQGLTTIPLGAVCVVDKQSLLEGIITDGDVRRSLELGPSVFGCLAQNLMTKNPVTIDEKALAIDALKLMEGRSSQISVLPVCDSGGELKGLVRIHDLLQEGLQG